MKSITIIGGGLSGLSASCYLAKNNFDVTLIDKNNGPGGRLSYIKEKGFTFDLGPTWYWMPDVFDKFFNDFDKKVSDYYDLIRLDPSYKFFSSSNEYNIPENIDELYMIFENIEKGSSSQLKHFMEQARKKYNISMDSFVYLPNNSFTEYFSFSIIKNIFALNIFQSLRKHIASYFKSKTIRDLLEFPSMFLGGTPNNTPALYSLMNYADIIGGTWYPKGGMYQISKGFAQLSNELGVKHIYNEEIVKFDIKNSKIKKVVSKAGNIYESSSYICSIEYPYAQMNLINNEYRSYDSKYWSTRNIAPSALIFYLGLSEKIKNIEHHNLFFDKDFDKHLDDIFVKKIWPSEPLFYLCCPSKTDSTVVPKKNMENIFILIPIQSGSKDDNDIREKYFVDIIKRIEQITHQSIKEKILVKKSFCINDFISRYNSYKGNAYGLANTLFQTAFLKPKLKDKKIKNLYYSGHFTVPGPGLPPAVISGKVVSNQIIKDLTP